MKKEQVSPLTFRANEDDVAILEYLQNRLGLRMPQVLRLAIRRLQEQELAAAKPARKAR